MKLEFQELYDFAKKHKDSHKSCGGEPYKSFLELSNFLENLDFTAYKNAVNERSILDNPLGILEIGTAVGFTTILMSKVLEERKMNYRIDTIEMHKEHIEIAKENILQNFPMIENILEKYNFIESEFPDNFNVEERINHYDLIFFDGYGPKLKFLGIFGKVLKVGGVLISANSHLKSAEPSYFESLETPGTWQFMTEFADTKIFRKVT